MAKHGRLNLSDCSEDLKESLSVLLQDGLLEKISPNVSFIEIVNDNAGDPINVASPKVLN